MSRLAVSSSGSMACSSCETTAVGIAELLRDWPHPVRGLQCFCLRTYHCIELKSQRSLGLVVVDELSAGSMMCATN